MFTGQEGVTVVFQIDDRNDRIYIDYLNRIISEAIEHGGDSGGAYFTNRDGLVNAMKFFLKWTGLEKTVGIMDCDGQEIRFYLKRFITEEK